MEIRKIKINKNDYLFINEFKSTRTGFKHTTRLFKNDCLLNESSVNYINRTWECYTYQTSMKKCINDIIELKIDRLKAEYKEKNNINRITEKHKKELNKFINNDPTLKEYKKIYKKLDFRY